MPPRTISNWDDAYANVPHIAGGADYPARWTEAAAAFRARMAQEGRADLDLAYGDGERNRFDLFRPSGAAQGLVVFVHGGYWMRFDRSFWSHLAEGPLSRSWAVAMPGYTLCPDTTVGRITWEIGAAIGQAAGMVDGPIVLAGHSAGGHLVTRMACKDSPLAADVHGRLAHVLSISGVHDLRPIMRTAMNATLRLTAEEARTESPVLLEPVEGTRLTCWVGSAERAEFLRQNALLANVWTGLGATTEAVEEPDRHHFTVIDGLADPDHPMVRLVCG